MEKASKTIASILIVLGVGALIVGGTSKWFTDFSAYTKAGDKIKDWANGSSSSLVTSSGTGSSSSGTPAVSGLAIRQLSNGTDASGHETRTFGYTIEPSNASVKSVTLSLAWTDATVTDAASDYFAVASDAAAQTITVVMLQRFSHQATLTVASESNASLTGKVTLDCLRHLTAMVVNSTYSGMGIDVLKSMNDDSTSGEVVSYNGASDPFFKVGTSYVYGRDAITETYDSAYTTVPASSDISWTKTDVSSALYFSYRDDNQNVTHNFDKLMSSSASGSEITINQKYIEPSKLSEGTLSAATTISNINTALGNLTDAQRTYVNNQVSPSEYSQKRLAYVYTYEYTRKYGSDTFTKTITVGLEVPFSSISFKVPVTGMSVSETGIVF